MRHRQWVGLAAVVALSLLGSRAAWAVPHVGDSRPDLVLRDAWDDSLRIDRAANKPMLLLYEDKNSSRQNLPLKYDLIELGKQEKWRQSLAVVAVADVASYDFWPARGIAKKELRQQSIEFGTRVYCDWDGSARNRLGVRRDVSNVVLYGKSGTVLFAHEGALSPEDRARVLSLLRSEAGE